MLKNFFRVSLRTIFWLSLLGIETIKFCKAEGHVRRPVEQKWSFKGPLGVFDRAQLQRGFQVYKEVCATCHSLRFLRYEKLTSLGFSKAEVKAIAAGYEVPGVLSEEGDPTTRKAVAGDFFARPYPNDNAARAANNGALPPDLSLIVKARKGGADYIYSLLTGYRKAPQTFKLMPGMSYNPYFEGYQIAMPTPLNPQQVSYSDGTQATVSQMAKDVTAFLAWVAEPESEYRRQLGIKVLIYLTFFTLLMYILMRQAWKKVK